MPADDYLDGQLQRLEGLVAGRHPQHPEVVRARHLCRRARALQRGNLARDAPLRRRFLLSDLHAAINRLDTKGINHD